MLESKAGCVNNVAQKIISSTNFMDLTGLTLGLRSGVDRELSRSTLDNSKTIVANSMFISTSDDYSLGHLMTIL